MTAVPAAELEMPETRGGERVRGVSGWCMVTLPYGAGHEADDDDVEDTEDARFASDCSGCPEGG